MPGAGGMTAIFLVLVAIGVGVGGKYPDATWLWPLLAAVMLVVFFAPMNLRSSGKSRGETFVELGAQVLRIPPKVSSDRIEELALDEIESLMFRPDPHGFVFIGSSKKQYMLPLVAFVDQNGGADFHAQLVDRIGARPRGRELLEEIDRRNQDSLGSVRSKGIATQVVLAVLAIAFFLQKAAGAFETPYSLLRFGANARALVFDGQWYRLFSANLLHGHEGHLVMNAIAIFSLGFMVERLLGPARFLLVFFISALTGSMASILWPRAAMSLGASTAVYGLFAAFAFLQLRYRTKMPTGFHSPLRAWGWIFALNIVLSFAPQIDWLAHLGGFVGGLLATFLVTSSEDRFPLARAPKGQLVAVCLLGVLFVAGAAKAVQNVRSGDHVAWEKDEKKVFDAMAAMPNGSEHLNALAWTWAEKKNATRGELEAALYAAERAAEIEKRPGEKLMVLDTVATIHHRLGNHDRAIELEATVLNDPKINDALKDHDRFIATQLARFMATRLDRVQGPLLLACTSSSAKSATDTQPGSYYVARAESGARIVGLLVATGCEPELPAIPDSWPKDTEIEHGLSAPLRLYSRSWNADPEALKLPP